MARKYKTHLRKKGTKYKTHCGANGQLKMLVDSFAILSKSDDRSLCKRCLKRHFKEPKDVKKSGYFVRN